MIAAKLCQKNNQNKIQLNMEKHLWQLSATVNPWDPEKCGLKLYIIYKSSTAAPFSFRNG